jgi:hypothetical protein
MNRTYTLQQLKDRVESLIEQQGAEASCAAFIFTKEDVFEIDSDRNEEVANKVLIDLNETDYIFEKAFDCIEDFYMDHVPVEKVAQDPFQSAPDAL